MKVMELMFTYKGRRDYVHGTDIVNMLFDVLREDKVEGFNITFNGMIKNRLCKLSYANEKEQLPSASSVKCKGDFLCNGERNWFRIEELEDAQGQSTVYDEKAITESAVIKGSTIYYPGPSPYTFVETIVPLNKELNRSVVSNSGKWLFVQLKLEKLVDEVEAVSLTLLNAKSSRLTRTEIKVAGVCVGEILFSMVAV